MKKSESSTPFELVLNVSLTFWLNFVFVIDLTNITYIRNRLSLVYSKRLLWEVLSTGILLDLVLNPYRPFFCSFFRVLHLRDVTGPRRKRPRPRISRISGRTPVVPLFFLTSRSRKNWKRGRLKDWQKSHQDYRRYYWATKILSLRTCVSV